ncbi:tail fiber assembly protein [Rodentibacter pneumotropicus]|uniref:tail fiber assembly protein n=1 Tax=Rodentibacter pneumotropicus TaxID=758 RepID=UPI001EE17C74|nr:tail fiber assembly protein [Rodentibacter pneumotropicus]
MTYPQQKTVYQYDETGIYLGETQADLSPLEAEEGVYLMPANTTEKCPENRARFIPHFDGENWQYVPDYRGEIYYSTQTGEQIVISGIGEIPNDFTAQKPLDEPCKWDGQKWVKDKKKLLALFTQRKTALLQRIADKTDQFKAQYLQGYSQAEIDSFYRQEREARNELPEMILTEIFEGRDDLENIEELKKKVIEKADLFAIIMGKLFAIKQNFETHIEQAKTLEDLDKIEQEIEQWQSI